jgi:hypothetical protein
MARTKGVEIWENNQMVNMQGIEFQIEIINILV